nr:hypothetical protein CFP56_04402 [Quercus suber]
MTDCAGGADQGHGQHKVLSASLAWSWACWDVDRASLTTFRTRCPRGMEAGRRTGTKLILIKEPSSPSPSDTGNLPLGGRGESYNLPPLTARIMGEQRLIEDPLASGGICQALKDSRSGQQVEGQQIGLALRSTA